MSKKTFRSRLGVERLEPRLCMSFGAVDTSFGTDGFVRFENVRTADSNDEAFAVASFPDGSVVMVGNSEVGKGPVTSFARLDSTGQLMSSFGIDGRVMLPYALTSPQVVAASDGSLYVGGSLLVDDARRYVVLRLLSEGTVDNSFGGVGHWAVDSTNAFRLAATPDAGVALLTHVVTGTNVPNDFRIWKLGADGQPDPDFGTGGATESFDPYFPMPNPGSAVLAPELIVDGSGRLVVAGRVYSATDHTGYLRLARFTSDGLPDATLGDQGILRDTVVAPANFRIVAEEVGEGALLMVPTEYVKIGFGPLLKQDAAGQIYVAMQTTESAGGALGTAWLAKANALGQLDAGFGTGGIRRIDDATVELTDFVVTKSGRVFLLLTAGINWSTRTLRIVGLDGAGHVDASFANQGTFSLNLPNNAQALRIVEDKAGRLLVLYRADNALHVHRLTPAGVSDSAFGGSGDVPLPGTTRSVETFAEMAVLGDQIFVAATTGIVATSTTVFALRADGSLQPEFGQSGAATFDLGQQGEQVRDITVLADGSIILGVLSQDAVDAYGWIVKLQGMDPSPVPLHNVYYPLNTTPLQDDVVSPRDALLVINYLTLNRAKLPGAHDPALMGYVDVNADNIVSPIDALLIINYLTRASGEPLNGEGEAVTDGAEASAWRLNVDRYWATAGSIFESGLHRPWGLKKRPFSRGIGAVR